MGRPAVPGYVTQHHRFEDCPPGHRFSLYFDGWNERWEIAEGEKTNGLRRLLRLAGGANELLTELRKRHAALVGAFNDDCCLVVEAVSTSPFGTGLGNEHPIENGFAFLTPYGLPYLAGSGVKGTLRRAVEELGVAQAFIDALFGAEDPASTGAVRRYPTRSGGAGRLRSGTAFPNRRVGDSSSRS